MIWYIVISLIVVLIICLLIFILIFVLHNKKVRDDYSADYFKNQNKWLVEQFCNKNVFVFGKKRTGKDLLFAHVIHLRNAKHYANIPYNHNTEVIELKKINVGGNTFLDIIKGNIVPFMPNFNIGQDIYLSDAGIFFPSQYYRDLDKLFSDMPIFFALSGHLYELNVHCNCQELGRVWDKLREQADCYIRVLGCVWYRNFAIVDTITYSDYASAERKILPIDKYSSEKQKAEFCAKHGDIVYRKFQIYKSYLEYDTHYFRQKFFMEIDNNDKT